MKLLASGFTTAASTFASKTNQAPGGTSAAFAPTQGSIEVKKIVFNYGSSGAADSSGGLIFRYGQSSGVVESSIVLCGTPSSVGISGVLDKLNISCNWFELRTVVAGAMGAAVQVLGD